MSLTPNLPAVTRGDVNIPIAGFKAVYDVEVVDRALAELPPSANEALKATYEKMLKTGGTRLTVKPGGVPAMRELYDELPNFTEVLDDVKKQIARRLAALVATGYGFVSMSSMTAGWILSGSSSQWKNSKPGKVIDTFLNGQYANPLILVDEIDKATGDSQYDPLGAL